MASARDQKLSISVAIVALLPMTAFGFAYPVYFLLRWGETIGKMVAGIKVTHQDGNPIAPGQRGSEAP